jgi:hypothetical protein
MECLRVQEVEKRLAMINQLIPRRLQVSAYQKKRDNKGQKKIAKHELCLRDAHGTASDLAASGALSNPFSICQGRREVGAASLAYNTKTVVEADAHFFMSFFIHG